MAIEYMAIATAKSKKKIIVESPCSSGRVSAGNMPMPIRKGPEMTPRNVPNILRVCTVRVFVNNVLIISQNGNKVTPATFVEMTHNQKEILFDSPLTLVSPKWLK